MITSILLFLFTYQKYGIVNIKTKLNIYDDSVNDSREATIILYPTDHVHRPTKTLNHHWNITKGYKSPDGVHKLVYLINGMVAQKKN
jgi:hypothetical protein